METNIPILHRDKVDSRAEAPEENRNQRFQKYFTVIKTPRPADTPLGEGNQKRDMQICTSLFIKSTPDSRLKTQD